jgi:hypothetical protein
MSNPSENNTFINPIDVEDIAENPHLLPYAHTRGGVEIRPEDTGKLKGRAVSAMYEQTDMQLDQIRAQISLLAEQAQAIKSRMLVSEKIYRADMNFEPLIGKIYHLYQRSNGKYFLSLIGPREWGASSSLEFVASVKLLADHTWDVLETGDLPL